MPVKTPQGIVPIIVGFVYLVYAIQTLNLVILVSSRPQRNMNRIQMNDDSTSLSKWCPDDQSAVKSRDKYRVLGNFGKLKNDIKRKYLSEVSR